MGAGMGRLRFATINLYTACLRGLYESTVSHPPPDSGFGGLEKRPPKAAGQACGAEARPGNNAGEPPSSRAVDVTPPSTSAPR